MFFSKLKYKSLVIEIYQWTKENAGYFQCLGTCQSKTLKEIKKEIKEERILIN